MRNMVSIDMIRVLRFRYIIKMEMLKDIMFSCIHDCKDIRKMVKYLYDIIDIKKEMSNSVES